MRQRTIGQDRETVPLAEQAEGGGGPLLRQAVRELYGFDAAQRHGFLNEIEGEVATADETDLPRLLAFAENAERLRHRSRRVRPVDLVDGNTINPEAPKTVFESFSDSPRTAVTGRSALLVPPETEFGGDDGIVSAGSKSFT